MTATAQDLRSILKNCLPDPMLSLQINQMGTQLSIIISRPSTETAINYEEVAETLIARLRSISLPNVNAVKLYGKLANTKQVEWQTTRALTTEVAKPAVGKPTVITAASPEKSKSKFQTYLEQFSHYSNVISAASLLGLLLMLGFNTLAGQKTQPTVWEYKIESIPDLTFTESMNRIGSDRWELVFARRAKDSTTDDFAYECIFRRVKQ